MKSEKFGAVLGLAPGGVPAYSSDYSTADDNEFPDRQSYRSFYDGILMGYKWQCVEFARRWLCINRGIVFGDVSMACDIFCLRTVTRLSDKKLLPLHCFKNGAWRRPEPGSLLIWEAAGEFARTGHVAVVTEVADSCIRIAEQNVDDVKWPEQQSFSRQLKARTTEEGEYWIEPSFADAVLLGWVIQTDENSSS